MDTATGCPDASRAGLKRQLCTKGRDVYFLQLRVNGFDPLRVRVKIDPKQGKKLRLKLEVAT
jgi:hypothetical protein